jgi:hypothetical protein
MGTQDMLNRLRQSEKNIESLAIQLRDEYLNWRNLWDDIDRNAENTDEVNNILFDSDEKIAKYMTIIQNML